jgi:hypothetical protein
VFAGRSRARIQAVIRSAGTVKQTRLGPGLLQRVLFTPSAWQLEAPRGEAIDIANLSGQ